MHEVFHFVWSNSGSYAPGPTSRLVIDEIENGVVGELGWSAESMKLQLAGSDLKIGRAAGRITSAKASATQPAGCSVAPGNTPR